MYTLQVNNLELIGNLETLYEHDIYIYGAAEKGKMVKQKLSRIGLDILNFCDGDSSKWNAEYQGKTIISPAELKRRANNFEIIILIASSFEEEIVSAMQDYAVKCKRVFTIWGLELAIHMNIENEKIPEEFRFSHMAKFKVQRYMTAQIIRQREAGTIDWYFGYPKVPIWICQPGKVASSSLASSLNSYGISNLHSHFVNYPNHILQGDIETEWSIFQKDVKKKQMKIIAAVREPVSRDYSAFWQPLTEVYTGSFLHSGVAEKNLKESYYKFIGYIMNGYETMTKDLGIFSPIAWRDEFSWFDEEFKRGLGIDIFQYPFDREKGYGIIEQGNKEVLMLSVEKMEQNTDIVSQFVGIKEFQMLKDNVAAKKPLHWAYDELKRKVILPDRYKEYYYSEGSKISHFYTQKEIKKFMEKGLS